MRQSCLLFMRTGFYFLSAFILSVALLNSLHRRLSPAFFARPLPFTSADIFAIEPRVKRMTSWLDPRAFQVTGELKEEAEGAVMVRFYCSFFSFSK